MVKEPLSDFETLLKRELQAISVEEDRSYIVDGNLFSSEINGQKFVGLCHGVKIDLDSNSGAVVEGNYGSMSISSEGRYQYLLNAGLDAINDLKNDQILIDLFSYTFEKQNEQLQDASQIGFIIYLDKNLIFVKPYLFPNNIKQNESTNRYFNIPFIEGFVELEINQERLIKNELQGASILHPVVLSAQYGRLYIFNYDTEIGSITGMYECFQTIDSKQNHKEIIKFHTAKANGRQQEIVLEISQNEDVSIIY